MTDIGGTMLTIEQVNFSMASAAALTFNDYTTKTEMRQMFICPICRRYASVAKLDMETHKAEKHNQNDPVAN